MMKTGWAGKPSNGSGRKYHHRGLRCHIYTIAAAVTAIAVLSGCDSDSGSEKGAGNPSATAVPESPSAGAGGAEAANANPEAAKKKSVRRVRIGNFDQPLYVTAPPGDRRRIFVVEQGGRIRVVRGGKVLKHAFLNLSGKTNAEGERGLLGMAFAPDYDESGLFYVDYTNLSGDTRIVEYKRSSSPDRADSSSGRLVLGIDQPYENHNGGMLAFGPDNLLYIGTGDGGSANDPRNNSQSLKSLLGKLLRIDPRATEGKPYRVPDSNPFVNRSGAKDEIYSYGLRNPWRFSFDRKTGAIIIGDVGQDAYEEIDYRPEGKAKGVNFGWPAWEGNRRNRSGVSAPGHVRPIKTYKLRVSDACSVTGGYVVRDQNVPGLYGRYVYGDWCAGWLRSFRIVKGKARGDRRLKLTVPAITSFGEDARGRVYATSQDGPVYRLSAGR